MTRTLQNWYVVVTGDLKSSRRLRDRAEVQEGSGDMRKFDVEISGLKETFLFKKKPLLKKKGKNKRYTRMPNLLQGSMN